jgi:eukaryotic-like serine/threonine-protein kinase
VTDTSGKSELSAGTIVGRYSIVRRLGAGGMGAVYEAQHVELGKQVALKVMLPELSAKGDMVRRFMNEARAAARIGHPGIIEVFDLGVDGSLAYIAMEKLEGEELQARIQRDGQLSVPWVIRIGMEMADAIEAAHESGIVHRDLKPANVFLARRGRQQDLVKILDFGIAKLTQSDSGGFETSTGAIFGTPLYMAPEQFRDSKQVDRRTDVYAIGAILYHALAGAPPFRGPTLPELIYQITAVAPPPIASVRSDVPEWLDRVLSRALAKEAGERFQKARELADALAFGSGSAPRVDPFAATGMAPPAERSASSAPARSNSQLSGPANHQTGDISSYSSTRNPEARSRTRAYSVGAVAVVLSGSLMAFWAARKPSDPPEMSLPEAGTLGPESLPSALASVDSGAPDAPEKDGGEVERIASPEKSAREALPRGPRRDPHPERSATPKASSGSTAGPDKPPPPLVPP